MAKLTISGRTITVDDSFRDLSPEQQNAAVEEIAKSLPAETSAAWDVVKQTPRIVTSGIENIATGPAKLAGAINEAVGGERPTYTDNALERWLRGKIVAPATNALERLLHGKIPDTAGPERKLSDLIREQGGDRGVGQYLPEPETPAGQVAKSAFESVAPAVMLPGGVGANALIGGLTGGLSEAAGQKVDELAPENPLLGAATRIGTSVVGGGALAGMPNAAARRFVKGMVPSLEDLDASSDVSRRLASNTGVTLDPTDVSEGVSRIRNRLLQGPSLNGAPVYGTEDAIPITNKLLGLKQAEYAPPPAHPALDPRPAPPGKPPVTLDDIDTFRKTLGSVAQTNASGAERAAARAAKREVDALVNPGNALTGDAAEAARLLERARADEAAGFRTENVLGRLESGELRQGASTGPNVSAGRQEIRKLIAPEPGGTKTKAQKAGFDQPEQEYMRRIVMGDALENLLRSAGATYASGGLGATAGLGAWYQTGDPTWLALAGAVPAARGGLQAVTRGITGRAERNLADMVASRSPEALRRWMELPARYRNRITSPIRRLSMTGTGGVLGLNTGYQQLLRDPESED